MSFAFSGHFREYRITSVIFQKCVPLHQNSIAVISYASFSMIGVKFECLSGHKRLMWEVGGVPRNTDIYISSSQYSKRPSNLVPGRDFDDRYEKHDFMFSHPYLVIIRRRENCVSPITNNRWGRDLTLNIVLYKFLSSIVSICFCFFLPKKCLQHAVKTLLSSRLIRHT